MEHNELIHARFVYSHSYARQSRDRAVATNRFKYLLSSTFYIIFLHSTTLAALASSLASSLSAKEP